MVSTKGRYSLGVPICPLSVMGVVREELGKRRAYAKLHVVSVIASIKQHYEKELCILSADPFIFYFRQKSPQPSHTMVELKGELTGYLKITRGVLFACHTCGVGKLIKHQPLILSDTAAICV